MKAIKYILSALLMMGSASVSAQDGWSEWAPSCTKSNTGFIVRGGYTIGGTAPIPIPAEIRGINEFSPKGGATLGVDAYHLFNKHWGAALGCRFFYEGFHTLSLIHI